MRLGTFLAPRLRPLYEAASTAIGDALGTRTTLIEGECYEDLLNGDLDAAFICGLPYVDLRVRAGEAVEPLAAPVVAGARYGGRPVYFSDVIVRQDDAARSFDDLRGRRWAYNEPESHSGSNVVLAHLAHEGLDTGFFSMVTRVGSHHEALRRVLLGEADAAAIDSHLLEVMCGDDPYVASAARTVTALGPSPIQPLVAGAALPAADGRRRGPPSPASARAPPGRSWSAGCR